MVFQCENLCLFTRAWLGLILTTIQKSLTSVKWISYTRALSLDIRSLIDTSCRIRVSFIELNSPTQLMHPESTLWLPELRQLTPVTIKTPHLPFDKWRKQVCKQHAAIWKLRWPKLLACTIITLKRSIRIPWLAFSLQRISSWKQDYQVHQKKLLAKVVLNKLLLPIKNLNLGVKKLPRSHLVALTRSKVLIQKWTNTASAKKTLKPMKMI